MSNFKLLFLIHFLYVKYQRQNSHKRSVAVAAFILWSGFQGINPFLQTGDGNLSCASDIKGLAPWRPITFVHPFNEFVSYIPKVEAVAKRFGQTKGKLAVV